MFVIIEVFMPFFVCRIARYNQNDEIRRRHEGALNSLESFVFEARAKLDLDEYQKAATQEEADAISKSCSEVCTK